MENVNIEYAAQIFANYGNMIYLIIFFTLCGETGIVFAGFLPGDSLVFASGALAASEMLNIFILVFIIPTASVIGNTVNYLTGRIIGERVIKKFHGKTINENNLEKAHRFYEKYGGIAVVTGRFLPVLRSLIPFAAGIAKMDFIKFLIYNITGSFLWSFLFLFSGFYLGNMEILKNKFWILTLAAAAPIITTIIAVAIRNIIKKRGGN